MPSMAAAIITPARLERDSRRSSVCIALPPPIRISSASSSRPASRQAADRVAPEAVAERRIGEQPLDQLGGDRVAQSLGHDAPPAACRRPRGRARRRRGTACQPPRTRRNPGTAPSGTARSAGHGDREAPPRAPATRAPTASSARARASRSAAPLARQPARELLARAAPQPGLAAASRRACGSRRARGTG